MAEFTSTTDARTSDQKGIYAVDYVAATYGTASIDFLIAGNWYPAHTMSEQTHEIVTIPPKTQYRITMSGGTEAVVRLTPLPWHRA